MQAPPTVAAALALVCLTLPACEHHQDHAHHGHQKIVVTSPAVKDVTVTEQYVCQIHSRRHIKVRALESGYLDAIPVREGQAVRQGDLLFQVVPVLFQARLEAERAEVRLAQIKFDNTRRLNATNVVSQQEVLLAEAELAKAQAKLRLAEAERNFCEIKAPFDGIIDRLEEQQGSLVKEEAVLTTLSDNAVMWVYFNVPEARYLDYMAGQMRANKSEHATGGGRGGDKESERPVPVADLPAAVTAAVARRFPNCQILKAEVEADGRKVEYEVEVVTADGRRLELEVPQDGTKVAVDDDRHDKGRASERVELVLADGRKFPHPGRIAAVEAKFNNETGNIPFRADFPNPDRLLRHGQTGNVLIHRTQPNALVIPQRATFEILNKQFVYVVDDKHVAHQREITVQHEMEDVFVIKSGLGAKDRFVLEGVRPGLDGQTVEAEFEKSDEALTHQKQHAE